VFQEKEKRVVANVSFKLMQINFIYYSRNYFRMSKISKKLRRKINEKLQRFFLSTEMCSFVNLRKIGLVIENVCAIFFTSAETRCEHFSKSRELLTKF
jgi:hypothetical protein